MPDDCNGGGKSEQDIAQQRQAIEKHHYCREKHKRNTDCKDYKRIIYFFAGQALFTDFFHKQVVRERIQDIAEKSGVACGDKAEHRNQQEVEHSIEQGAHISRLLSEVKPPREEEEEE